MTQREWEKKLLRGLKKLPRQEKTKIVEYYREIYGDKQEAGYTPDRILAEFGSPEDCAARILSEEHADLAESGAAPVRKGGMSVAAVVGLVFATLLLILPLTVTALGVIVTFAAVCVSGCAVSLVGLVLIPWSLFTFGGTAMILAGVGIGIAAVGVGAVLFVLFLLATKYTAVGVLKALKLIYVRGENHE